MKFYLTYITISLFLFSSLQGQQFISAELLQSYTVEDLNELAADNGIPAILLAPEFGIDYYRVTYETTHPLNGPVVATGGMAVPKDISCAVPIASYQHGTSSLKMGVPGFQSQESLIGIILASTGYMVILPDYIGLGGSPGMHPYVHADTEALAVIDLIRATREFVIDDPVRLNDQIFLFGYSQGGHATMAAHKKIQEELSDEMWVTASYPMSGPYDVSGVQTAELLSGEPYATPSYLPYIMLGYQAVYENFFDDPSEVFASPYDVTLPPLFDGTFGTGFVNAQCDPIVTNMIEPALLQDFLDNPETHFFRVALRDNDVYEWIPESPIRMGYCTGDEQVVYTNALVAQNYFESQGVTITESIQLGVGDHNECVTPALLSGIQFFKGLTTANNGIIASVESDYFGTPDNVGGDALVTLIIENDPGNLEIVWSTGETDVYQIGVDMYGGGFNVQITDVFGCTQLIPYEVEVYVSVDDITLNTLNVFPNPSTELFNIETPTNESGGIITAYSIDGSAVAIELAMTSDNTLFDLSQFPSGTYIIEYKGLNTYKSRVVLSK